MGDTILVKGVVTAESATHLCFDVPVVRGGVENWSGCRETIAEEIIPAPTKVKHKLGTVLYSVSQTYVVVDEEEQLVAQVFDSNVGGKGTIHKIADISVTLYPIS